MSTPPPKRSRSGTTHHGRTRCGRRPVAVGRTPPRDSARSGWPLAVALAAAIVGAWCTAPAQAADIQRFTAGVASRGSDVTLQMTLQRTSDDGGIPSPSRRTRFFLPQGFSLATRGVPQCRPDVVAAALPAACEPAAVGAGSVRLSGIAPDGFAAFEPGTVRVFNGPTRRGAPTIVAYLRVTEPISHGWWLVGVVRDAKAPFGTVVDFEEAALRLSGWPLTVLDLSVTIGGSVRARDGSRSPYVRAPRSCPASGWPFAIAARFYDRPNRPAGNPLTTTARAACPNRPAVLGSLRAR